MLGSVLPNTVSTARSLILISPHQEAINVAGMAKEESSVNRSAREAPSSPLETAKQIAMTMCRQQKEAHWLGVRMENFSRAYQRKMQSVTAADVCDYLEGLMRKGQVEWQVKQSLDAIGLLMWYGY